MHETILHLLGTEHGLTIASGGAGGLFFILGVLLLACRAKARRLRMANGAFEQKLEIADAALKKAAAQIADLEKTYAPILDVDREIERHQQNWKIEENAIKGTMASLERQLAELRASTQSERAEINSSIEALRAAYASKRETYDRLNHEVAVLEDRLDMADLGMYRPVIHLGSTAEYKAAIELVRAKQKAMITGKTALVCPAKWTVEGSEAKGRQMVERNIRMTLRAYNNECEVLINKVSWKTYESMRGRIVKSREAFNKLNESLHIVITQEYENLKLEELRLVYEEALKHQEEKDRIREDKEREREEAKAQRELQAEIARSEKREREREAALAEARSELAAATQAERAKYEARVADLEQQLAKAHEQTERTKSMAEQTRIGHVYIISNIGSFGDQVFKIGMTRRLEPLDRIRELGDASVPFPFEVHALIFTENAPGLERELHAAMEDARVNRVNLRKEFFRASGFRVAEIVRSRFPSVVYVENPQSQEYLGSLTAVEPKETIIAEEKKLLPAAI